MASSVSRGISGGCIAIAVSLLAACESGTMSAGNAELSQAARRFVPPDATDQVIATGVPWAQIDFVVRRSPFDYAFDEREIVNAAADGWLLCRPKSDEWWAYEDRSVTPSRYLQQRVFTLFKDSVLVLLVGKYKSPSEQEAISKSNPGSEKPPQQGIVSARKSSRDEATELAKSFDLSCVAG
jgi:hypothetical protein